MWKPIGVLSTLALILIALLSLALAAWDYDQNDYNSKYSSGWYYYQNLRPYIDALRAVLACDLLMFITAFVGIFFIVKPNRSTAKCYVVVIVLLIIFKILAGAIWYSGVNDTGKFENSTMQTLWDDTSSPQDWLKAWHAARGCEIASIILFIVLGGISAVSVLKLSG